MDEKFKLTKFNRDDTSLNQIRYEILPSGKVVAFGIAGTDLSTLQFGDEIDFNKESDVVFEKYHDSKNNMAFVYVPNVGFDEVDTKTQTWFKFN